MREPLTVFQQALVDSVLNEYANTPREEDLPDMLSANFKAWAEMFQKKSHSRKLRVGSVVRKILIAAIIATLLAGTAMAIPAIRETVIDFFFHEDDTQIGISFDPEQAATAPHIVHVPYVLRYIPNTYTLLMESAKKDGVYYWWTDDEDRLIVFMQQPMPDKPTEDSWWTVDGKDISRKTVLIDGYLVEIIRDNDNYKLVWTNNAYVFTLELPESIDEVEMHKIFANWGPKE